MILKVSYFEPKVQHGGQSIERAPTDYMIRKLNNYFM